MDSSSAPSIANSKTSVKYNPTSGNVYIDLKMTPLINERSSYHDVGPHATKPSKPPKPPTRPTVGDVDNIGDGTYHYVETKLNNDGFNIYEDPTLSSSFGVRL